MRTRDIDEAADLEAYCFALSGEDYVLFSYALPRIELPARLTKTERDLIGEILRGLSNDEIARKRGRSPHTIANQLHLLYRKVGVTGRGALIARYARSDDEA